MSGNQQSHQSEPILPEWYTDGQFDALLICSTLDSEAAHGFVKFVKTVLYNDRERSPTFITLDSLACGENGLKRVQYLMDKSTFVFMFVTDNYATDDMCRLLTDEIVIDSVRDGDSRWRLIPIITQTMVNPVPMGLKSLNALNLKRLMVCNRVSDSLKAVNRENLNLFDSYLSKNIRKLFAEKDFLLKRREKLDEIKFNFWKATNGLEVIGDDCD